MLYQSTAVFLLLTCFSFPAKCATPEAAQPGTIVIGFLGGFVGRANKIHNEVQLAERLMQAYPSGLAVRMFENHHGRRARLEILRLLDTNGDGSLSDAEKRGARIAIYGHSWGASEAVTLARALGRDKIPVLLTIQVDSVRKFGEDDGVIPANVSQAVNFYESNGLLHGRPEIRASDESRTRILGNFRYDYKAKPLGCEGYPWFARHFMRPHIEIESDPVVWQRVENLIRSMIVTL
jgi:hypothetical protein